MANILAIYSISFFNTSQVFEVENYFNIERVLLIPKKKV